MASEGKIAVVTGGGSGIGRATAHVLLEAGWNVVLAGRRADMLEETASARRTPRRRARSCVPTDLRDKAQIDALFDAVKSTYGRIDLLFNNAGISTRNIPFEDLTYEQWSDVVAVNLTGAFLCAQHAFRMMKAQDPQGRPHHQQRLGVGACAPAQLDPLCLDQARADRPDARDLARRARIRHLLRPDRHRQRRDRRATKTPRAAGCKPPAGSRPRRAST